MIFMLKKRPWSESEIERMASWSQAQPVIVPGRHVDEPYASLFAGRTSFAEYVAQAPTARRPRLRRPSVLLRQRQALGPAEDRCASSSLIVLGVLLPLGAARGRVRQAARRAALSLRGVDRLLREPRRRLHRGGARAAAAPDAAARPPDLHALDPALHAARRGRPRQLRERPLPAGARVPRDGGRRRALRARAAARGARAAAAAARGAHRDRDPARGPARLPDGDAVPARACARPARGRSRSRPSTGA